MLKTKLIKFEDEEAFENELGKFINTTGPASIQYRTSASSTGAITHSALVVYEVPDELEGDKTDGDN